MKSLQIERALPRIVARSRTLWDLEGRAASGQGHPDPSDRRSKWIASVGGEANWEKRIEWSGLRDAHSFIGESTGSMPGWAEICQAVMAVAPNMGSEGEPLGDEIEAIPFGRLLSPFVRVGWERLLASVAPVAALDEIVGPEAARSLRRELCQQRGNVAAFVLNLEFRAYVGTATSDEPPGSRERYEAFVAEHLHDGFVHLFDEYPVLARLLSITLLHWVDAMSEMLIRTVQDAGMIAEAFPAPTGAGILPVADLFTYLSDPHREARTVCGVQFANGLVLAYKPKKLDLEVVFFGVIDWINRRESPALSHKLATLRVLDRGAYGWCEWVERANCSDGTEVARYYHRAGILLALLTVLQTTDVHTENLMAAGEHPVLVDLETVMQPQEKLRSGSAATGSFDEIGDLMWGSVLRPGLLPQWTFDRSRKRASDLSGLGHTTQDVVYDAAMRWHHVNTDQMRLGPAGAAGAPERSTVAIAGQTVDPEAYVGDLVAGFEEGYRFLMRHREAMAADDGPLAPFRERTIRYVVRATDVYSHIQTMALRPRYLRSGIERGIALDVLARAYLSHAEKPPLWDFLQEEIRCLDQLDVPIFYAQTTGTSVRSETVEVPNFFREGALDSVYGRLRRMSEADLALQKGIIEASFYVRTTDAMDTASETRSRPATSGPGPSRPDLVRKAAAIGQTLLDLAARGEDGSLAWLGLAYIPEAQRKQLRPIGGSLYDGDTGIALFFASLANVTADDRWRQAAYDALANTRRRIDSMATPAPGSESIQADIGGATGIASIAYALAKLGSLLEDPELLEDAGRAIDLITPAFIGADRYLDVIAGSAGALLGALTVHRYHPRQGQALGIATACGRHLLATRVATATGLRAWPTLDERCLTGFSHGAAGIGYALARAGVTTGDPEFRDAAAEAFAYEDALFDPMGSNWPDLRLDEPTYCSAWCHGAAGIVLARVLASPSVALGDAVETAIERVLRVQPPLAVDHLCCGTTGVADILWEVGHRLDRPALVARARELVSIVAQTAEHDGLYRLQAGRVTLPNPGIFQGLAGVGLTMLRMASEAPLPRVLAWE
ncbi:MAG: type 2 lanthipeptide synthetase LanM family protein [Fimbriimonas sp.]